MRREEPEARQCGSALASSVMLIRRTGTAAMINQRTDPVTVVIAQRVKPGREEELNRREKEAKQRKKNAAEFELVDLEGGSWTIQVPRRKNK